jgi:hypothetical protein
MQESAEGQLDWASLSDYIDGLPTGVIHLAHHQGLEQRFGQEAVTALIAAMEPLAGIPHSDGVELCFRGDTINGPGLPTRVQVGRTDLLAISSTWGSRARRLSFVGVALAGGFFPALLEALPQLSELWLRGVRSGQTWSPEGPLAVRLVAYCQRVTHPLTIWLESPLLE